MPQKVREKKIGETNGPVDVNSVQEFIKQQKQQPLSDNNAVVFSWFGEECK